MKKRIILFVLLAGIIGASTTTYSAVGGLDGIGIYGNFFGKGAVPGGGIGLSLKFGNFPVLGIEWSMNDSYSVLGVTGDWWIWATHLTGALHMYVGIGAYIGFGLGTNFFYFDLGLRGVIGLQIIPIKPIEIFLELSPMLTFLDNTAFALGIAYGGRIGVRFRF